MSTRFISIVFICMGFLLMLWALMMDITVSTRSGQIFNLHLASQQQTYLLIGGLFFLAGVILFSVAKLTQAAENKSQQKAEIEVKTKKLSKLLPRNSETFGSVASNVWNEFTSHFSRPTDFRLGRALTGIFVGIYLMCIAYESISYGAVLVLGAAIWIAFRPIPGNRAIKQLLGLNTVVALYQSLFYLYVINRIGIPIDEIVFYGWVILTINPIFMALSATFYWLVGKRDRSMAQVCKI